MPIPMFIVKLTENNVMYSVQELHLSLFLFSVKVLTRFVSSIFSVHFSTSGSTNFFYTYNLNNLNIHQYHKIHHIHIHSYLDSK